MKNRIVFLILLMMFFNKIIAVPADSTPRKMVQPNGDTILVYLVGDEYGSWYEDVKGNIIDLNSDKYWVYVTIDNGEYLLTNQIVTPKSLPLNINRDSIMNFILKRYEESYVRMNGNDFADNQRSSSSVKGKFAFLPTTGQNKILTVLVQFADVKFQDEQGVKQEVINMMSQHKYAPFTGASGSVKDYYLYASYNQLDILSTVIGPYTVSNNRAYYGDTLDGQNDCRVRELAEEVMMMIKNDINVSQFDNNNDGWVECIHIYYAGQGQHVVGAPVEAIWPHRWYLEEYVYSNGIKMSNYMMTPELRFAQYSGIGVICHELGHILGSPDFYDVNYEVDEEYEGTGSWDLMAAGNNNNFGNSPAYPNPYIKTKVFNWAPAVELIGINQEYVLRPSELDALSIYKLSTSTQEEYYLLENKQQQYLPGTGLVIYHVKAGIDTVNRKKINITHPQYLYVVDASNDLAKPTGSVASYDTINSPNATFRSTNSRNMYFTSISKPSNCNWNGDTTYNKDVCFISEEVMDGEKCIKFVLNPEIEGYNILCDSAIYSLIHVPSEATIEWTYTRPSGILATTVPLIIGSGQGTKAVCFKRGYKLVNEDTEGGIVTPENPFVPAPTSARGYVQKPYSGFVEIQAKVTLNGETKIWRKTIYMPERVEMNTLNFGTINYWFTGTTKTITLKSPTDPAVTDSIKWYIELPGETPREVYGSSITVTPTSGGTARFTATYTKGCGDEYMSHTKSYNVIKLGNWTYTNPASGSVEISVTNGDVSEESGMRTMSINNQPTPYMGAYRVELWHDIYGKVREMDVAENNPTIVMNLDGLNSGVYVLRLIIDNQIVEASQLIVR